MISSASCGSHSQQSLYADLRTRPDSVPGAIDLPKAIPGTLTHGGAISCLAFTPDGTQVVAGTSGDATLFVWQIQDGRLLRMILGAHGKSSTMSVNPRLNCVAVTPDGARIMSVGQTTKPVEQTKLGHGPRDVTMSEVRFWDIETGQRVADYHGDDDYGFGYGSLSRDGRHVAVADFSRLRILDASTGKPEQTIVLPGSWGRPARVLARRDGRRAAARQHDRTVRGIDGATTAPRREHARRPSQPRRRGRRRAISSSPVTPTALSATGTSPPES